MPTGLFVYVSYAYGPCLLSLRALAFLYLGPSPDFVDLMIGYIDCLAHDMLSCSILNIARHLEPQNCYSIKIVKNTKLE